MRCYFRIPNLLFLMLTSLLASCVSSGPPAPPEPRKIALYETPLQVGVIYRWDSDSSPMTVLDLVTTRTLNERTGSMVRSLDTRTRPLLHTDLAVGEYKGACAPTASLANLIPKSLCGARSPVRIELSSTKTIRDEMTDPFALLELLNRPMSGLVYNQEAETRVIQWRTAIAGAVGASSKTALNVCIYQETLVEGLITVNGKVTPSHARALALDLANLHGLRLAPASAAAPTASTADAYQFPVSANLQTGIIVREIIFAQASSGPRTDFSLQGPVKVSRF